MYTAAVVLVFVSGFFARGLFDRGRVSGTADPYQNVRSELRTADKAYSRVERNLKSARGGIAAGIERAGTIGNGLDGIESLAIENTKLLGRAERILLDAGTGELGASD
jgi:hypothetical protein